MKSDNDKKLIVIMSSKKQGGKSSACKALFAHYINRQINKNRFLVQKCGKLVKIIDSFNNDRIIDVDFPNEEYNKLSDIYSIKIYSFADPLKEICINVFGLDIYQCYGTDDNKNSQTHILWEDLPENLTKDWCKNNPSSKRKKHVTARQLMQMVGQYCRSLDPNCWARGLYNRINQDNKRISLICDARYPNEVSMGTERGAKVIRLGRSPSKDDSHESEIALDNFPISEYSLYLDNSKWDMDRTHKIIKGHFDRWYFETMKNG